MLMVKSLNKYLQVSLSFMEHSCNKIKGGCENLFLLQIEQNLSQQISLYIMFCVKHFSKFCKVAV